MSEQRLPAALALHRQSGSTPLECLSRAVTTVSGTRTTALAETGFGIANPVQQYKPTIEDADHRQPDSPLALPETAPMPRRFGVTMLQATAATSAAAASEVSWAKPPPRLQVLAAEWQPRSSQQPRSHLVTWVGISDAITAISNGAVPLAFNGVGITPANPLGGADLRKITEGQYTAWGYEHLFYFGRTLPRRHDVLQRSRGRHEYRRTSGISGIPLDEMNVGRTDDGGTVAP